MPPHPDDTAPASSTGDVTPVLIALYLRGHCQCLYPSPAAHRAADDRAGQCLSEALGAVHAGQILGQLAHVAGSFEPVRYELPLTNADGSTRWVEVNLLPHVDAHHGDAGAIVVVNNITACRDSQLRAQEGETRLEKFLLASVEGIVFHKEGTISDVNPPLCRLLGYDRDDLVGRFVLDFVSDPERERVGRVMRDALELRYESQVVHRNGELIPVELIARSLSFGGETYRMNIVRDIRERVAAEARIHQLADHDRLTGLLSRSAFMAQLEDGIQTASACGRQLALLFIDLNDFKRVNDSLGHAEGDRVLVAVAERLRACLREADQVARFGGDEFAVLLSRLHSRDDVLVVLHALLGVVAVPIEAHGRQLSVTPSIGIALYPEHGHTAALLVQHADTAMYHAKRLGQPHQFFVEDMAERAYAELVIESQLRDALRREEFELFFQPQVEPVQGALVGAEALLRWRHPERGLLTPDAFIGVAERSPLMVPLSHWVLRQAAMQAQRWHQQGTAAVPIAVNLSHLQFRLPGFAESVRDALREAGAAAQCLQLEITERMLLDDVASSVRTLESLRAMGVSIAVDDFGTGHTALAHLTRLPLDKLKIDQCFVADLPHDRAASSVARAIIHMAHGLGLRVGAEGVSTPEQWRQLQAWGCDELQGTGVAAPMSAGDFEKWVGQR